MTTLLVSSKGLASGLWWRAENAGVWKAVAGRRHSERRHNLPVSLRAAQEFPGRRAEVLPKKGLVAGAKPETLPRLRMTTLPLQPA